MVKSPHQRAPARLEVTLGKIKLTNPTILASGVLGVAGGGLVRAWKGGAGAVVTKTIGKIPKPGHPGPRLVGVRGGSLLNAMGLPNPGVDEYLVEISDAISKGVIVIASIMGDTPSEYADVASKLVDTGVVAIELNVSCPHVGSLYSQGMQPDHVGSVVRAVRLKTEKKIPIWVKLPGSTDYPRLVEVARSAETAGAAAIVAINTLPAIALNIETQLPALGGEIGGLSGPAIKPIAIRVVWELYKAKLEIPIIGVGGIITGSDVIEFILAGASAIELGTGILLRGSTVFDKICKEINAYLLRHKIEHLQTLLGKGHIKAKT